MSKVGEIVAPRRMGTSFRWLLSSSWTSNIGDGIALAAGPLLVASQTDSAFLVVLALCVVIATGHVSIGVVLAVMFLYGVAEVFADSASQTLLPMLVEPRDLGTGNARLQAGFLAANQFLGPPVGAFLVALGTVWPFVVQVVCVALAVVLVGRIATQPGGVREMRTHVRQDIAEGVRWILGDAPVRTLALVVLVLNVTWVAPWGVLVKYALDHLDMGEVGFGLLTTASAIGGVIGVTSFGWVALVIMVVFGAYGFVRGTLSNTIRQRAVPTEFQGRVGSVYMVCGFGGIAVGQALGGVVAQAWGITAPLPHGRWAAGAGSPCSPSGESRGRCRTLAAGCAGEPYAVRQRPDACS